MEVIALSAIPNQSFSLRLENNRYDITLKETRGCMSATVVRNDIDIIVGARVVAGTPLLPYKYQEDGNFFIETMDGEIPDWNLFGITQRLLYFTIAEIEAVDAGA